MVEQIEELRKRREIWFRYPASDPNQARTAMLVLNGLDCVETCETISTTRLAVCYDIRRITLREIEKALNEAGFRLENSLIIKLKRALYHYLEDMQLANMGCEEKWCNCTRNIFINCYQHRAHGCRDHRPEHWRRYL